MFRLESCASVGEVRTNYRLLPEMVTWPQYWARDCKPYTALVGAAYVFMRHNPYGVIGNDAYTLLFDSDLNRPGFEHHVDGFRARLMLLANKSEINLADNGDFPPEDFGFISMIFYYHRILLLSVSLPQDQFIKKFPESPKPDYPRTSRHLDVVSDDISRAIDNMIIMRSLSDRF